MFDDQGDFEYERRFYCREFPVELRDENPPALIVQSYYVHSDNFALRVRLQSNTATVNMSEETDALAIVDRWRASFTQAFVTVKGPMANGTRYEAERSINPDIAIELVRRGGTPLIKNRYSVWLNEDGWSIDIFGGRNHPLIVAEVERSSPVTELEIPWFCTTEITADPRFANDALADRPFADLRTDFESELATQGPHFSKDFGHNRHIPHRS